MSRVGIGAGEAPEAATSGPFCPVGALPRRPSSPVNERGTSERSIRTCATPAVPGAAVGAGEARLAGPTGLGLQRPATSARHAGASPRACRISSRSRIPSSWPATRHSTLVTMGCDAQLSSGGTGTAVRRHVVVSAAKASSVPIPAPGLMSPRMIPREAARSMREPGSEARRGVSRSRGNVRFDSDPLQQPG